MVCLRFSGVCTDQPKSDILICLSTPINRFSGLMSLAQHERGLETPRNLETRKVRDSSDPSCRLEAGWNPPVNNMLSVHVRQCCGNLGDVSGCPVFRKSSNNTEMSVNISTWSEFENEVYAFVVVEVPIQAQNVDVSQICLNLDFTPDLELHLRLDDLSFVNYLQAQTGVACQQMQQANTAALAINCALQQLFSRKDRICKTRLEN